MDPTERTSDQIEVFFGATSELESKIYLRAVGPEIQLLQGRIRGPFCKYSRTLPADYRCSPLASGQGDLQTIVPDPCFWTPDLPFVYEVTVRVASVAGEQQMVQLPLGIRPLAVSAAALSYAGRRYVMRMVDLAVVAESFPEPDLLLTACRETGTVLLLPEADEALFEAASRAGVLLAVRVAGSEPLPLKIALRRLARWPAVGMAILDEGADLEDKLDASAANLILACRITPTIAVDSPGWAEVMLVEESQCHDRRLACESISRPVMAIRYLAVATPIAAARALCDDLQRETAPLANLAGYIVSCTGGTL